MSEPRLVSRLERVSRVASVLVVLVGALVFVGWALNHPLLNRLLFGRFIMQLNSGAAFVLAGASLLLRGRARLQQAAGALVAAIGLFVVGEYAWLGVPDRPGRMELETAIGFWLLGAALVLRPARGARLVTVAQLLTVLVALGELVALNMHIYAPKFSYGLSMYQQMTVGTVLTFLVLCVAILCADPDRGLMAPLTRDSVGGFMARRLYPAVIGIPLILGWLTLLGERMRLYNGKLGLSILLLSSIVVFVILVSVVHRSLDRTDAQKSRLQAVLLEESERRNIARELHDEIGQTLTALKCRLEMSGTPESRELVGELMARVSSLSLDLRPAMLDDLGLLPAVLWLTERYGAQTGIRVDVQHAGVDGRFSREVETAAFRIVQEALSNVARHAGCERVQVRLWADAEALGVEISDTGRGFDARAAEARGASSGLRGMRERAEALGGQLAVDSRPGAGARVTAELPLAS